MGQNLWFSNVARRRKVCLCWPSETTSNFRISILDTADSGRLTVLLLNVKLPERSVIYGHLSTRFIVRNLELVTTQVSNLLNFLVYYLQRGGYVFIGVSDW